MNNVQQLKEYLCYLKSIKNTKYGSFGEKIFSHHMSKIHKIEKLHKHGADFLVDDLIRIDVKTSLMLDKQFGASYKLVGKSQQLSNTDYAYVLLLNDQVALYQAKNQCAPTHIANISWDESLFIFNTEKIKVKSDKKVTLEHAVAISTLENLVDWLVQNFNKKAKFVIRHNKATQDRMSKNGWGPEAFYHDPISNKGDIDLVLLLFFDAGVIYDLFAYPLSESAKINWQPKKVGLNLTNRKTFSPSVLHSRYKFKDIDDFKKNVGVRFSYA